MSSWFKKNKKSNEQATASSVEQSETRTSYSNLTTTTIIRQQTSLSVSRSYEERTTSSGPPLRNYNQIALPSRRLSSITSTDARPINLSSNGINLNYQSPYRNSPVYRSLGHSSTAPVFPTVSTAPSPRLHAASSTSSTSSLPALSATKPKEKNSKKDEPKKIVVKTKSRYDCNSNNNSNPVSVYSTSAGKRGEVLIINNIMFKDKGYRKGAELDDKNLKTLFTQIGFNVTIQRNLKQSDMERTIKDFSNSSKLNSAAISVVVVMSHGTNHNVVGGYTEIFGLDDKGMPTETIVDFFSNNKCPKMAGKPKIFIFQCCRGDDQYFTYSDAKPFKQPSLHSDMLIAYSTLPGFVSLRDPQNGTWYIQTICEVFSQFASNHHIEDLLKIVGERLQQFDKNSIQTSTYESRGFNKKCYLHHLEQ